MSAGSFKQGIICAAAWLEGAHGESSYASELLRLAFKDWNDILRSRPDAYDLEKLEPLRKEFERAQALRLAAGKG